MKADNGIVRRILKIIAKGKRFLVTAHVRSDGDALGSALALNGMLKKMGKLSHVVCDRGVSHSYAFMPGAKGVGDGPKSLRNEYDAMIVVDCGNRYRLERVGAALPKELFTINIDHHASNERFGDINWIDPSYSSTGEMAYDLIKASRVVIDKAMATNAYVAIVTDTGKFSFSNTTPRTHLNAAELISHGVQPAFINNKLYREKSIGHVRLLGECIRSLKLSPDGEVGWVLLTQAMCRRCGFEPGETQEFIEMIKSLMGVRVALLFREASDERKVKVSFRTDLGIDGTKLAGRFGGGGHPRAAGCSIDGSVKTAEKAVIGFVRKYLKHGRD